MRWNLHTAAGSRGHGVQRGILHISVLESTSCTDTQRECSVEQNVQNTAKPQSEEGEILFGEAA